MSTNVVFAVRTRNKCKQPCVVRVRTFCLAEREFCQIPDVGAQVHTLGLRGAQQKCSRQPRAVHRDRSRIGNSEILACRGYKNLKMIRLVDSMKS